MGAFSFVLKHESSTVFNMLSDADAGRLIKAVFDYETTGSIPQFDGALGMGFSVIKGYLDVNREKYERKCVTNRENGEKGGRPPKK